MKLREYIDGLTDPALDDYAKRCGTTPKYLKVKVKYGRGEPRRALREALSRESGGQVSDNEVLEHFGIKAMGSQAA